MNTTRAAGQGQMSVPQGEFDLSRHPLRGTDGLRAWDAADEYVLGYLDEVGVPAERSVVVVNDAFGALAVALAAHEPLMVSDSQNAHIAVGANASTNGREPPRVTDSFDLPDSRIDVLVVKVPKSEGELVDLLHRLRPALDGATLVVGAGMTKQIHSSTVAAFEDIVGPTTTSLAKKKARLIHSTVRVPSTAGPNPWPRVWSTDGIRLTNHAGIFSPQALDAGSAMLLEHLDSVLDSSGTPRSIVDLGCGNGVLGITVAARRADAELRFVDESRRAVQSARESWNRNHANRSAEFVAVDRVINHVERGSVDLVVCNPPFHDQRSRGDAIAWDMFVDSYAILAAGGSLVVVGNRHLGYHAKLGKIFGNCTTVGSNRSFVVLHSVRR